MITEKQGGERKLLREDPASPSTYPIAICPSPLLLLCPLRPLLSLNCFPLGDEGDVEGAQHLGYFLLPRGANTSIGTSLWRGALNLVEERAGFSSSTKSLIDTVPLYPLRTAL